MDELGKLESLTAKHDIRDFSCGKLSLDSWLAKYAVLNQKSGSTRTFVLPTIPAGGAKVVAYYSLVTGGILREDSLAGIAAGTPRNQAVPVIILARLAVDKRYQKSGLGRALLKDCLKRCLEISKHVGFRAVLVHTTDDETAEYYRKNAGFESSPTNSLHLMLPIQDIAEAFK